MRNTDGSYFYRELVPGTKTYRQKKIEGVSSMDEAEQQVLTLAVEMNSRPEMSFIEKTQTGQGKKKREKTIEMLVGSIVEGRVSTNRESVEEMVRDKEEKCDVGLLERCKPKRSYLSSLSSPYLELQQVTQTNQIKMTTFDDYPIYRSQRHHSPDRRR